MGEFKVGDLIKGNEDNGYMHTGEDMLCAKVIEIIGDTMDIKVTKHNDFIKIGEYYVVINSSDKFSYYEENPKIEFSFVAIKNKDCKLTVDKIYTSKDGKITYDNGITGGYFNNFKDYYKNSGFSEYIKEYLSLKSLLKDGMVCVTKAKYLLTVEENTKIFRRDSGNSWGINEWNDDLTDKTNHDYDIVKIMNTAPVWEYKEPKIVTLADIKKHFGDNITIDLTK